MPITLTKDAIEAIKIMKSKLISSPILAYPNFYSEHPFIVTTDASFIGIAFIISQIQQGKERIICYVSRKLNEAEKRYHINKLELLAVITAIEKNKFLLFPRKFKLKVDNRALLFLNSMNPPGRLIERWIYMLSNYSFDVEHKRSKEISNVDYFLETDVPANQARFKPQKTKN